MSILVQIVALVVLVSGQNGEIYPASAIAVLTNAMRFDGRGYMKAYKNDGAGCGVPAAGNLGGMFLDLKLSDAAKFHSQDMAAKNFFDHSSLDGTSFAGRIGRFYKDSGTLGENIAQGTNYDDPVEVMSGWLKSPGHCVNIFGKYDRIGTGTAERNDIYKTRATQDFSLEGTRGSAAIAAGSHLINGNGLKFIVAIDGQISKVDVIVGGKRTTMSLEIGSANRGMYQAQVNVAKGGCQNYYFEAVGAGGAVVDRFPDSNAMQTGGFGQCAINAGTVRASEPTSKPEVAQPAAPKPVTPQPAPKPAAPVAQPPAQDTPAPQAPAPAPQAPAPAPDTVVQGPEPVASPQAPDTVVQGAQPVPTEANKPKLVIYTAPAPVSEAQTQQSGNETASQVGPAVSTQEQENFKASSVTEKKRNTIVGVVIGGVVLLILMAIMLYYIRRNLHTGEKWNSPKLVRQDSTKIYKTLSRRKGPSSKKMAAINGLPHLEPGRYPQEIISRQASISSPYQSPATSECLSPAPLLQSDLVQVRRESSWKLVASQMNK